MCKYFLLTCAEQMSKLEDGVARRRKEQREKEEDQVPSGDDIRLKQLTSDLELLKQQMEEMSTQLTSSMGLKRSSQDGADNLLKELKDMREKHMLQDIKINDHDMKILLILKNQKKMNKRQSQGFGEAPELPGEDEGSDVTELIALIDKLKDDLRSELASKIDTESFDRRSKKLVDETNVLFAYIEEDKVAIKAIQDKIQGHSTRLQVDSELIHDLQNNMRKLSDNVKQKADGEEIDSINQLVSDMYEKILDFELGYRGRPEASRGNKQDEQN